MPDLIVLAIMFVVFIIAFFLFISWICKEDEVKAIQRIDRWFKE